MRKIPPASYLMWSGRTKRGKIKLTFLFVYKRPKSKIKKKLYKGLALTRRILIEFRSELMEGDFDVSPLWFHHTGRNMTWEERVGAKHARIKRALENLRQDEFVSIRKDGNRVYCFLTEKGNNESLKEGIRIAEDLPEDCVCMLSFDVPEQERKVRVQMRRLLKDLGFKMEHQSLWICRKDIFFPLSEYLKELGVFKWFHLYEARILK
jgi:hypothetical protein